DVAALQLAAVEELRLQLGVDVGVLDGLTHRPRRFLRAVHGLVVAAPHAAVLVAVAAPDVEVVEDDLGAFFVGDPGGALGVGFALGPAFQDYPSVVDLSVNVVAPHHRVVLDAVLDPILEGIRPGRSAEDRGEAQRGQGSEPFVRHVYTSRLSRAWVEDRRLPRAPPPPAEERGPAGWGGRPRGGGGDSVPGTARGGCERPGEGDGGG